MLGYGWFNFYNKFLVDVWRFQRSNDITSWDDKVKISVLFFLELKSNK